MAMNVSYTPSSVKTTNYSGSPHQYLRLNIKPGNTQVTWDASTHVLSIPWSVEFRTTEYDNNKKTERWNVARYQATLDGTTLVNKQASKDYTFYMTYSGYSLATALQSGTFTKSNVTTTQNLTMTVKQLVNYGYTATRWNNNSQSGSATLVVTIPEIGNPTISATPTKTSASRGGANGSVKFNLSMTAGDNASISSYSITCNGSTQSNTNPATFTGLKNNTSYSWSAAISNNGGKTGSASGSFILDGQIPLINSITVTPARTGATLSPNVSYDTNASQKSVSVKYGTSTSYGSTATS